MSSNHSCIGWPHSAPLACLLFAHPAVIPSWYPPSPAFWPIVAPRYSDRYIYIYMALCNITSLGCTILCSVHAGSTAQGPWLLTWWAPLGMEDVPKVTHNREFNSSLLFWRPSICVGYWLRSQDLTTRQIRNITCRGPITSMPNHKATVPTCMKLRGASDNTINQCRFVDIFWVIFFF